MKVFNFFLISEFTQILDSFGKSNLSSKYRFNGTEDLSFVIDTKLNKNNDLVFTFNFYKKNKKLDVTDMSTLHILNLLDKFRVCVENLAPFKQDLKIPNIPKLPKLPKIPKIPKYKALLKHSKISLSLMKSIIKQSDISRRILYLFVNKSLNIYTVNGLNNVGIARTIVKSFDRIDIISSEFIKNKNLDILINLHNLNITLFNYFIQNNLSLLFHSLMAVITIVRIYILMVWILYNIGIFAISGLSLTDPVNMLISSLFYVSNLVFLAVWLFLPRLVIAMIKFKMKIGSNR
jgi:hypothetical protein